MDARPGVAGSLGPRLAGRLTAELVLRSPQYMNCVKEYEIDLRGTDLPPSCLEPLSSQGVSSHCCILQGTRLARLKTLEQQR